MFSTEDLKTAIGATVTARRNAAARLREAGNPRDPFRALPGMEQQFFEAAQSVRTYDLILKLLENETKREALKRMRPARVKITKAVDRMVDIYVGAGLIALATLGFAAALLLLDELTEQEVSKNKAIRGYIVRALAKGSQNALLVRQITNALVADGLIYSPDISKPIEYLQEAGYVTFTDRSVNAYNAYRKDSIIKLTRKGVDLVEGTINDPGIDV